MAPGGPGGCRRRRRGRRRRRRRGGVPARLPRAGGADPARKGVEREQPQGRAKAMNGRTIAAAVCLVIICAGLLGDRG